MKTTNKSLAVQVEALPALTAPKADAAAIKAAFVAGCPARSAAFDKALLEGLARVAAANYLRALGQID